MQININTDWEWYENTNVFRLFYHCLLHTNLEDKRYCGKEIKAGHVRNVYALKLGYIIYLNDRSPETYTLYPMWVLDCNYVENKNKEIKVNPYSDDIRDCFSFERICINPETAEMMDFLNPKTSMLYAP